MVFAAVVLAAGVVNWNKHILYIFHELRIDYQFSMFYFEHSVIYYYNVVFKLILKGLVLNISGNVQLNLEALFLNIYGK